MACQPWTPFVPFAITEDIFLHHRLGGERGYLTIENIKDIYSTSKHPAVAAGKMTREEALQEFLNSFEGSAGNRDGKVTLDEWMRHYEEVSCSIDHDDYFGTMMASTWAHLKQKMPDGSKVCDYVPSLHPRQGPFVVMPSRSSLFSPAHRRQR